MKKYILLVIGILISSSSFAWVDDWYEVKGDDVYWFDDFKLEDVDVDTFEIIAVNTFARDKNHIYGGGDIIKEVDYNTFEPLHCAPKYTNCNLGDMGFAKDKNNVYFLGQVLEGADAETFRVMHNFSADRNNIYDNGARSIILKNLDAETFDVLEEDIVKDKNGTYEVSEKFDDETGEYVFSAEKISENNKNETQSETLTLPTYIKQAQDRGYLQGYPDGTLQLENPVNRAEFAKMLMMAFEQGDGNVDSIKKFSDVKTTEWYAKPLAKAVELEIMQGYPDGNMKPAETIIMIEAVKMALETKYPDEDFTPSMFGKWYSKYLSFIQENFPEISFIDGDLEYEMTRGECVELIEGIIE